RTCRHSLEFDTTWPCGGCSGEHDWLIRDSVTGHLLLSDLWSIQRISHPQTRLLVSPSAPPRRRHGGGVSTKPVQPGRRGTRAHHVRRPGVHALCPNDWSRPPQSGATAVAVPEI